MNLVPSLYHAGKETPLAWDVHRKLMATGDISGDPSGYVVVLRYSNLQKIEKVTSYSNSDKLPFYLFGVAIMKVCI